MKRKLLLSVLLVMGFLLVLNTVFANKNKRKAQNYCKQLTKKGTPCKVSAWVGCGPGWTKAKAFRGRGKDYFACKKTKFANKSDENKKNCQNWCEKTRDCEKCSPLPGCGIGFKKAKKFGGKGKNWYACKKRGSASVNTVWPRNSAAKRTHKALVVSLGGAFGRWGRDGIEWFANDYLSAYKKQILYVGSYGSVWTVSKKLAKNIKSLANAIKRKSGKKPKIILIGKSMGGCKMHHATRKMGNYPIDLFISVDMCCKTKCYPKLGKDGINRYKSNVKKFVNFYQEKPGEGMCGYIIAYDGKGVNKNLNVNVNKDGFNHKKWKKTKGRNVCNNVGHKGNTGIDKCKGLKNLLKQIVLNEIKIR